MTGILKLFKLHYLSATLLKTKTAWHIAGRSRNFYHVLFLRLVVMFAYYVNPTNKSYNFNYLRWKVNPLKHFLYRKNWLTAKAKEERRHLGCSHVLDEFLARRLRVISLSNETNFFINKHLLLTTKPKYMRGRVSCPNDTRRVNGALQSLKVPSTYQFFAPESVKSCASVANIRWRRLPT